MEGLVQRIRGQSIRGRVGSVAYQWGGAAAAHSGNVRRIQAVVRGIPSAARALLRRRVLRLRHVHVHVREASEHGARVVWPAR